MVPRLLLSLGLLLLACASAQQQQPDMHVVSLHASPSASRDELLGVFQGFGVAPATADPLLQKVASKGEAVVIAGAKASCEAAAEKFVAVGAKATVRPMRASDRPSEYSDSDVLEADTAMLEQLMESSAGALVTFYAPWCGHCRQMVPDVKKAATLLKPKGVRVAAVNTDNEPGLAQRLGIRGFPTVRWVGGGSMVDYQGPRKAMELMTFAQQQHTISAVKGKVSEAVQGVKAMGRAVSKMAMSKILGRQPTPPQQGAGAAAAAA